MRDEIHPFEEDLLPSLSAFVSAIAEAAVEGEGELTIESISATLPFELDMLRREGELQLRAGPPTQRTATTILPVWHRISVTVVLEEAADARNET